jgi:hypothetical protein
MRRKLRNVFRNGTGSDPAWGDNGVLGHSSLVSKTVPATLTKGSSTDCSALILGDFTKLVIGIFGPALDIVVDRYALKRQNMIEVTIFANVWPLSPQGSLRRTLAMFREGWNGKSSSRCVRKAFLDAQAADILSSLPDDSTVGDGRLSERKARELADGRRARRDLLRRVAATAGGLITGFSQLAAGAWVCKEILQRVEDSILETPVHA